jgi:hypothetical protein
MGRHSGLLSEFETLIEASLQSNRVELSLFCPGILYARDNTMHSSCGGKRYASDSYIPTPAFETSPAPSKIVSHHETSRKQKNKTLRLGGADSALRQIVHVRRVSKPTSYPHHADFRRFYDVAYSITHTQQLLGGSVRMSPNI